MITVTQMTEYLSTGLNAVNNIANTEFVIIPDVSRFKRSTRSGNTVTNYINGILLVSPSANETTNGGLVIAIDQFALHVLVPLDPIKTTPTENPIAWQDDINEYVQSVRNVIDEFFSVNTTGTLSDGEHTYSLGYTYSTSATSQVARDSTIGTYVEFTVNIAVTVVQSGVNSMNVTVTIDGKQVPYQSFTPSRTAVQTANVFSDSTATKVIATGSTFGADMACPALRSGSAVADYLINGGINKAHIMGLEYGETAEYFLVQFVTARGNSSGVMNVGENYSLAECAYIPDLLAFPDSYTVSVTTFDAPTGSINVTVPAGGPYIYLLPDGSIAEHEGGTTFTADVPETGMCEGEDGYYAYIISVEKEEDNADV